jgi:2-desacetyl-2-hydroxyethyl bacteriochlorophyllide A dehydrogenase
MRAVEWQAPGRVRLVERDDPVPDAGQAVVNVVNCGICGSDLHSFFHGVAAKPGQVLGHEFSGRVVSAPEVDGIAPGDRVTVRPLIPCGGCAACGAGEPQRCERSLDIGYGVSGAFAERVLVPRAVVGETVFRLPDAVDDRGGALVEPLAVGMHAIARADADQEEVIVVLGAGMIGLGVIALLHSRGCKRILAVDLSQLRRERARVVGAAMVVDPAVEDVVAAARNFALEQGGADRRGADLVIDCAGAGVALESGLRALKRGGRVILVAAYGREVQVYLDRVIGKEISLIGSIGYRDEFPEVLRLLAEGRVNPDDFVSHTFALDDIDEAIRTQADVHRSLKVLVQPADHR